MQLGIRIITSAFQNKINNMEQEIRGLRLTCDEQRGNVSGLQKKTSALEVELVESHQRSQQLAEENKELFRTVNSLRKQITRLEHLKQQVLSSIQDDHEKEAEQPYDSRVLMNDEFLRGATPLTSAELGFGATSGAGGRLAGHQQMLPHQAATTPAATVAPPAAMRYDTSALAPPAGGMGVTTPPAGVGGAAVGGGSSPVIDGKQFFRQARSRLSYEAFNLFLASIKRLNSQQQSREETLDEARRIFGPELQDLYRDFENLLNRHNM